MMSNEQLSASFTTWVHAIKNLLDAAQQCVDTGDLTTACDLLRAVTARQTTMVYAMTKAAERINAVVPGNGTKVVVVDPGSHG